MEELRNLVAGVDFSGSKAVPNETWLAIAELTDSGVEIQKLTHVGSHKLAQVLTDNERLLVAALDFPFSLPNEFTSWVAQKADKQDFQSWQEIAMHLAFLSFETFYALVEEFHKEPKRYCDKQTMPMAISPLHRGNPSMVQMTYQGIHLLARLNPEKFRILPFQDATAETCQVIEVYPSATLCALGLPFKGYKSVEKKDREAMFAQRKAMIRQLESLKARGGERFRDLPQLLINAHDESTTITSHDAFDAVIACYTAGIFAMNAKSFVDPLENDTLDVLTEGWIFQPVFEEVLAPPEVKAKGVKVS